MRYVPEFDMKTNQQSSEWKEMKVMVVVFRYSWLGSLGNKTYFLVVFRRLLQSETVGIIEELGNR